jgi:hypothetical protein
MMQSGDDPASSGGIFDTNYRVEAGINNSSRLIMTRGLSLHIGVNVTDVNRQDSKHQRLHGCVNDALAMCDVASRNGFAPLALLTDEYARFGLVEEYMRLAASLLGAGDTFLMTFSGHGARLPSVEFDDGAYDEAIVLHDLTMKDNYIYVLLRHFKPRCRVILVSDSCYSGTIYRIGSRKGPAPEADAETEREDREHRGPRMLFASAAMRHWKQSRLIYDELDKRFGDEDKSLPRDLSADVVVLTACQDNELAHDGERHGKFTEAMLCLLGHNRKMFTGSYQSLTHEIHFNIANEQRPSVTLLGPNADNPSFQFFQGPVFSL